MYPVLVDITTHKIFLIEIFLLFPVVGLIKLDYFVFLYYEILNVHHFFLY